MTEKLPHIHVIGTGGTIAAKTRSLTETTGYSAKTGDKSIGIGLTAEDLLASVPGIERHASLSCETVFNVPSSAIGEQELLLLSGRINEVLARDDVSGAVVTHGTDTLEETAFFLHLTVKSEKPVVVVGSMRPATVLSADGPLNLFDAILAAASPESRGKGVLVSMCGRLISARDAAKTSTFAADAFKALHYGILGEVVGGAVHYYYAPVRPHTLHSEFDVRGLTCLPRVEIVCTHQNCTELLLKAAIDSGCDGVVCAGMGSGAIPPRMREYYKSLDRKPPLVRGTRVFTGYVAAHGATPDAEYGTIPAGDFSVIKARILLQLALTQTRDPDALRAIFQKY